MNPFSQPPSTLTLSDFQLPQKIVPSQSDREATFSACTSVSFKRRAHQNVQPVLPTQPISATLELTSAPIVKSQVSLLVPDCIIQSNSNDGHTLLTSSPFCIPSYTDDSMTARPNLHNHHQRMSHQRSASFHSLHNKPSTNNNNNNNRQHILRRHTVSSSSDNVIPNRSDQYPIWNGSNEPLLRKDDNNSDGGTMSVLAPSFLQFLEKGKEKEIEEGCSWNCLWSDCRQEHRSLKNLTQHVIDDHIASGKSLYYCEWQNCPRNRKPFTKRHKIHNHFRTHTGEKPFICEFKDCQKRFSRLDSLVTHSKVHSNIRPFQCKVPTCTKAYFHARSLRKHLRTHLSPSK